jgi:hypothetical protein
MGKRKVSILETAATSVAELAGLLKIKGSANSYNIYK